MEHELPTLPEHVGSPLVFNEIRVVYTCRVFISASKRCSVRLYLLEVHVLFIFM